MVSQEGSPQPAIPSPQPPRISFSGDFINGQIAVARETNHVPLPCDADFEFLSLDSDITMLPADELFFQGTVLPFWPRTQPSSFEKLGRGINVALKAPMEKVADHQRAAPTTQSSLSWFVDEDPSPRPPKCTVLWKELLKLKKQQSSEEADKDASWKRKKKGLERARSASVRIRPVVKMPICTHGKNTILPL